MATYKEIFGTNIEVLASDPANPVEGQVWYNSTSNVVKGEVFQAAAWATGGNLNTAVTRGYGFGQKTSALSFGGLLAPGAPNKTGQTESYNGSAWTEVNDLNTARYDLAGAGYGDNTAGLCFSGQTGAGLQVLNESWNGTSWTEVADLNTSGAAGMGAGTSTSALRFGTQSSPFGECESWNGSSWTEVAELNNGRRLGGAGGIDNTSALAFGGNVPGGAANLTFTESWNGTSWTEVADLNTGRTDLSGNGTVTSALASAGVTTPSTFQSLTESWNGTSWTETTDLSTVRRRPQNNAGSNNTSALLSGGESGPGALVTNTEEWTGATTVPATFTDS